MQKVRIWIEMTFDEQVLFLYAEVKYRFEVLLK